MESIFDCARRDSGLSFLAPTGMKAQITHGENGAFSSTPISRCERDATK